MAGEFRVRASMLRVDVLAGCFDFGIGLKGLYD
jgi:hypothetical protein